MDPARTVACDVLDQLLEMVGKSDLDDPIVVAVKRIANRLDAELGCGETGVFNALFALEAALQLYADLNMASSIVVDTVRAANRILAPVLGAGIDVNTVAEALEVAEATGDRRGAAMEVRRILVDAVRPVIGPYAYAVAGIAGTVLDDVVQAVVHRWESTVP